MRRLAAKWIVSSVLIGLMVTTCLADLRIRRRITAQGKSYDCSPDLSGSITPTYLSGRGRCFNESLSKRRYFLELKRIGPTSLGYPLLETRTSYNDKGEAEVVTEEVLELSRAPLDASLFEAPTGFTQVDFKTNDRSFLRRLFSFLGK